MPAPCARRGGRFELAETQSQPATASQREHGDLKLQVVVESIEQLPPRAWLADISDDRATVLCGAGVDVFDGGIVEGAWDGPFEGHGFDTAANFFGSGLLWRGDRLTAVCPTHTLESLYVLRTRRSVLVSNSLCFVFAHGGAALPVGTGYCRAFASVVRGIDAYDRSIHAGPDFTLTRHAVEYIDLHAGRVAPRARADRISFSCFDDYYSHLEATIRAVFDNGGCAARRQPMTPLTTLSSGYDSAACAALGAQAGCAEAVSLRSARGGDPDSGQPVAQALGLGLREFDRAGCERDAEHGEVEFLATGMGGEDYVFSAFRNALPGRLLLTGFHGDSVWDVGARARGPLERGDISGSSLAEFRLRVGFTNVPVPFIGALRHAELRRIAASAEMQAYRLGNAYDRPVPRRIAEQAGVPRASFGQKKRANSILFFQSASLLSDASARAFSAYARTAASTPLQLRQLGWLARLYLVKAAWKLLRTAGLPGRRLVERLIVGDFRVFEHASPLYGDLLFLWSLDALRDRYRARHAARRESNQLA